MKSKNLGVLSIVFTLVVVFVFSSCKKEEETIATIIIRNELGSVVPGASVRLFGEGTADAGAIGEIRFDTTQTTNGSGKVSFNFTDFYKQGQAGFVVLDIEATKGNLYGVGIIKVEEESTTEEILIID